MRSRIEAVVLPAEPSEFREDVRRIFRELDRTPGGEPITGECAPALDVFETDESVEIRIDLPGVDLDGVKVVAKGLTVLIAGYKRPRRTRGESTFHLVERGYGRFARVVRLSAPCDTSRARAMLSRGELRVSVPRVVERRGRSIDIPVSGDQPAS